MILILIIKVIYFISSSLHIPPYLTCMHVYICRDLLLPEFPYLHSYVSYAPRPSHMRVISHRRKHDVLFYANDILGYLREWWGIKLVAWLGLAGRMEGRRGGGYLGFGFGFGFALAREKANNTMQA